MALNAFTVKLTAALADGKYSALSGTAASPLTSTAALTAAIAAAVALVPSRTALDAAMAVLVADGASPTQAHVTTANNALTAFETALTAYSAAVAALSVTAINTALGAPATLLIDPALITSMNQVDSVLRHLRQVMSGSGFTA